MIHLVVQKWKKGGFGLLTKRLYVGISISLLLFCSVFTVPSVLLVILIGIPFENSIALIGAGQMGQALARGFCNSGECAHQGVFQKGLPITSDPSIPANSSAVQE